jgi:hypothetical protein
MHFFKSVGAEPDADNTDRSFVWSLGGALLASICCVGPLVAILVLGGAAAGVVGLIRFKLEFIAVGLIVTLVGISFSLRKSKRCCSIKTYRRNRILIPAVSLLTFAVLVVGSNVLLLNDRVIGLASSRLEREPKTDTTSVQLAAPSARRLDVEVTSGVYCPACLLGIQKKVGDAAGVQSVTLEQGADGNYVARILYDPALIDQGTLVTTIANAPGAINGPYGTKVLQDAPTP